MLVEVDVGRDPQGRPYVWLRCPVDGDTFSLTLHPSYGKMIANLADALADHATQRSHREPARAAQR